MTTTYDILAAHPFVEGMPTASLGRLSEHASLAFWPAGHRLFDEGGSTDRFWLITSGRVALDLRIPGRGDVLVDTLVGGQVLGWSWLFPPNRWHFGATITEPTEAVELDGPAVLRLCEDPGFGSDLYRRFLQVLVDRLQATRIRLLDLYGSPLERSS